MNWRGGDGRRKPPDSGLFSLGFREPHGFIAQGDLLIV